MAKDSTIRNVLANPASLGWCCVASAAPERKSPSRLCLVAYLNHFLTSAWKYENRRNAGKAMHTPRSAARAAGVTKSAIYGAIKSGRLPACRLIGGSYAIYPGELLRAFPMVAQQAKANAPRQSSGTLTFPAWDVS